jgi:REP element-mobilizing transposase RayT
MPRPLRPRIDNGIYHVFNRGNRKGPIFLDEFDLERFLELLQDLGLKFGWPFFAYCLMTNHFHLVVETPEGDVSTGMHRVSFLYAQYFNRKYAVDGHVFQGRFKTVLIRSDVQLLAAIRYVLTNPVRAGLTATAEQWKWSSYRATVGIRRPPPFLSVQRVLRYFGTDPREQRERFAAWIAEEEEAIRRERAALAVGRFGQGQGPDPGTWPVQPTPYVPGNRSPSSRTSSAAGRPTTFR